MPSESDRRVLDTQDSLANLNIVDTALVVPPVESNPWQDTSNDALQLPLSPKAAPMIASDISTFDPATTQGLAAVDDLTEPEAADTRPRQDILQEFDPLASHEELAAKEAWESSESHPPPSSPPHNETELTKEEPVPPPGKPADTAEPPLPTPPLFPSLAALARTFALPLTSRPRPRSLDTAAAVPSPATISSFASQQDMPRTGPSVSAPTSDSGRSTPTRAGRSADSEPPQFDFQRFLDQMKLKSAEPVAKYLRSYVSTVEYIFACTHCCE